MSDGHRSPRRETAHREDDDRIALHYNPWYDRPFGARVGAGDDKLAGVGADREDSLLILLSQAA
jgi:hypothetical protein